MDGFPADIKVFHEPNFEILGAPIEDAIFCAKFLAQNQAKAVKLLSQMSEVGSVDPQIALLLLCHCATFCKLVHLARSTSPALVSEGLALFDVEVRHHFCDTVAIDPSDSEWLQVQLSLSRGGLGLQRLALHCSAAYLASVNKADCSAPLDEFTLQAVTLFNSLVPPSSSISEESLLEPCLSQKDLPSRINDHQFDNLCLTSTPANHAHLLSVASCHASSWLAVILSRGFNLSLDSDEFQVALKWWLGMDTSSQLCCPYHPLDPFEHHAMTCSATTAWEMFLHSFVTGQGWVVSLR